MDSNPQLVMRCAGTHHHCRPRRGVDSNHRRVIRCAGAHHHPRPCRCMDSNHRLVIRCAGAHQRFRPRRCMGSDKRLCSSAVHTEDTYIDLRGAKYRSDNYGREPHTYTLTFRAGAQVGGRRDPPHSDVHGCYYVLTDAVVSHIEVQTATTWCRASVVDHMSMPVHVTRAAITQEPRRTDGVPVHTNSSSRPVHG